MRKYGLDDLIGVNSFLQEYWDNDDSLKSEYDITYIPIAVLKTIFPPFVNDPELYMPYPIKEDLAGYLKIYLKSEINFDFKNCNYFLQRYGIYKDIDIEQR